MAQLRRRSTRQRGDGTVDDVRARLLAANMDATPKPALSCVWTWIGVGGISAGASPRRLSEGDSPAMFQIASVHAQIDHARRQVQAAVQVTSSMRSRLV